MAAKSAKLVTQDNVYDGNSNMAGQTTYAYDGATPTATSGVPQHVAATGTRGNLTSKTVYASSGTSYTSTATYYDTGLVSTSTGPAPTWRPRRIPTTPPIRPISQALRSRRPPAE